MVAEESPAELGSLLAGLGPGSRARGTEVRIGRRSKSRRIEPEIDLAVPPGDPGVSRLHAVLVAGPDRNWSVVDSGSDNGILVNGQDVPSGGSVLLRDGDRIHLGAWTVITITCS